MKGKVVAVRKRGKWWLWTEAEKERESLGMEKGWRRNMSCEGKKGWGRGAMAWEGYLRG